MKSVVKQALVAIIFLYHAAPSMAGWTWSPAKTATSMSPWISYNFAADSNGSMVLTWVERSYSSNTYFTDTIKYKVLVNNIWSDEKQLGDPITGYGVEELRTASNSTGEIAVGWRLVDSKDRQEEEPANTKTYIAKLDVKKDAPSIFELNELPIVLQGIMLNDAGRVTIVGQNLFEDGILSAVNIDGTTPGVVSNIGKGISPISIRESNGAFVLTYPSPDWVDGSVVGSSFFMKGARLDSKGWQDIDPIFIDAPYGSVYFLTHPELHASRHGNTILSFNVWREANPYGTYRPYIYILDGNSWRKVPPSSAKEEYEQIESITTSSDGTITQLSISPIDSLDFTVACKIKQYKNDKWLDITPDESAGSCGTVSYSTDDIIIHAWIEDNGQSLLASAYINNKWSPPRTIKRYAPSNDTYILYPQITTRPDGGSLLNWLYGGNGSVDIVTSLGTPKKSDLINLVVKKIGDGLISSEPAGISCGPACTNKFKYGQTVSLLAKPIGSYQFSNWNNQCGTASKCDIPLFEDTTVTATFKKVSGTQLKIIKSKYGVISSSPDGISCGNSFNSCTGSFDEVNLTATPNPGYTLKKWVGCPAPTDNTCSLTLTKKALVNAVFAKLPKYVLKIVKTKNGEITSDPAGLKCKATAKTCSAKFVSGTRVRLTPNPLSGYRFTGWSGACTGTAACEVTMDAKKMVGAQFE